ncbi:MAG: hypothetical protein GX605_03230 [Chloroflexi bacterium]|nr:hypothetical protein [Chloroflexota bacterium]
MNDSALFYRLQMLDVEADEGQRRLQEIAALLSGNEALAEARRVLGQAQAALSTAQAALRELELQSQSLAEKTETTERRLYSGQVRNPKELAGLEEEHQYLLRRRLSLDEELLEAMVALEEASDQEQAAQAVVQTLEAEWAEARVALRDEQASLQARLAELAVQRQPLAAQVKTDDLRLYEGLRPRRGGRAVALVRGRVCQGCGMAVPTAFLSRVRDAEELMRCPNCDRILTLGN